MDKLIDSVNGMDTTNLTIDSLNWKYGTGRSYTEKKGSEKVCRYRCGVMTDVGDIREDVWEELVLALIVRDNERRLYDYLYAWYKADFGSSWTEKDVRQAALKAYTARLYDNTEWCDYIAFNQKYRPCALKEPEENQ